MSQYFAYVCFGVCVLVCSLFVFLLAALLINDFRLKRLIRRRIALVPCPSCGSKSWRVVANPFAWQNRSGLRMTISGKYVQCQNCQSYFFASEEKWQDDSGETAISAEFDLTQLDTAPVARALSGGRVVRRRYATVMSVALAIPALVCAVTSWYDVAVVELTVLTFVVPLLLTGCMRSWVFGDADDSTTFS